MNQTVRSRCYGVVADALRIWSYTEVSCPALAAVNDLPPLPDAICAIVCGSAGTGTVSPWTSIVPFERTERDRVDRHSGLLRRRGGLLDGLRQAIGRSRPIVGDPSLINTTAAPAFLPSASVGSGGDRGRATG